MKENRLRIAYISADLLFSALAWLIFYFYRKVYIEKEVFGSYFEISADRNFYVGIIAVPLFWFLLFYIYGLYNSPTRRSRLKELGDTLLLTLTGTIILFFALMLDDSTAHHSNYYISFMVLFSLQFILTWIPRFIITTHTQRLIHSGKRGFNTIIIGSNGKAEDIYHRINGQKLLTGNIFTGFIETEEINGNEKGYDSPLSSYLPCLGNLKDLDIIMTEHNPDEIIIAEDSDNHATGSILNRLWRYDTVIKSIPGVQDVLLGKVRLSSIYGTPLLLLSYNPMPFWQQSIKRILDLAISIFALIITLPITIPLAVAIKVGSKGPVIYRQERMGRRGKLFYIYKLRSMVTGAEENGPLLSSPDDSRVTSAGRFMRRYRFDEIPNFINVLRGEMSLVGPRPERKYYVDQIIGDTPEYLQLLKVRPGVTSWGQVLYGYASTVEEMKERMLYDLLYLKNLSLYVDFKIIIYTIITVLKGRGV